MRDNIQKNAVIRDNKKSLFLKSLGIKTLYIWEKDIHENLDFCEILIERFLKEDIYDCNSYDYKVIDKKLENINNQYCFFTVND